MDSSTTRASSYQYESADPKSTQTIDSKDGDNKVASTTDEKSFLVNQEMPFMDDTREDIVYNPKEDDAVFEN